MKSLILMYVYYDSNNDIKAITPNLDENLAATCQWATFPVDEVTEFLTAQKNPFDYRVKQIKKATGITYKIARKESQIVYTRTLDNYLTKVDIATAIRPILLITVSSDTERIIIEVDKGFKDLAKNGTEEEMVIVENFTNRAPLVLYFTKKNDPYSLLHTLTFSPKSAMDVDKLYFECTVDLSNSSVYTKKVFDSYGYRLEERK